MSDADTPTPPVPEQPLADVTAPLPDPAVEAPVEAAGEAAEVAAEVAAPAPSPEFAPPATLDAPHPTEQFSTSQFPTAQIPAAQFPAAQIPAAEAPTTAMPMTPAMAPAPSSVVLGAAAAPKKKGVLAWALAGVAAIAAVVFAILWVGSSGDADDLTAERDQLVLEKSTVTKMLDTANADLEAAQAELADATSDLDSAQSDIDELQTAVDDKQAEVDDLTEQLESAQSNQGGGGQNEISDRLAQTLGEYIGTDASPALTDAENICLGRALYEAVGFELFVEVGLTGEPTDEQLDILVRGIFQAANKCDLPLDRLNP